MGKESFLWKCRDMIFFSLLLVGGGVCALFFSGWDDWWRLSNRGIQATAGVLKMEMEYRDLSTRSSVGFMHHHVRARFFEKDSQTAYHDIEYEVSGRLYKRLKGMDSPHFEIIYDPQNPKLSAPQGDLPGSVLAVLFGIGLIVFGIWVFFTSLSDHLHPPLPHEGRLPIDSLLDWIHKWIDRFNRRFPSFLPWISKLNTLFKQRFPGP
jgi:hypothetical protein